MYICMKQLIDMEERLSRKEFWDGALKAGLVLGLVAIVYTLAEEFLQQHVQGQIGGLVFSLVTFFLWAAKFAGCILLMRMFMSRFAAKKTDSLRQDVRRYGTAIALTSALLYSGFILFWSKYVDTEMFSRNFEQIMAGYSSMLDSNTMSMMEGLEAKMPVIAFFSNFIYCFLFGTILSSILANSICKNDPFAGGKNPFSNDNQ